MVEMAVVLVLCSALFIAFYSLLASQMLDATSETSEIKVQNGIRTPMSELTEELQNAHLYALDSFGNYLCYQVPRKGTSGSVILTTDVNNNAVVQYGAYAFSDNTWIANGYYQIVFRNHTGATDILIENQITNTLNPLGQNLSGTYTTGTTTNQITYDKGFQLGHFEIEVHNAPVVPISPTNPMIANAYCFAENAGASTAATGEPGGTLYSANDRRIISGTALRQIDPLDTNNGANAKRTSPWGGGFFFMRNPGLGSTSISRSFNCIFTATGATVAAGAGNTTGTFSAQFPDGFDTSYDINNSGYYEFGENFDDTNKNNFYDGPDCDSFADANGNNVPDGNELGTTALQWNGQLRLQLIAFDARMLVRENADLAASKAAIRILSNVIKIRNK